MPTLPLKDYLYLGIILALIAGFGWYTYHERSIGRAQIEASDAKLAAANKERNDALTTTAALANSVSQKDYDHVVSVPVINAPVPNRLCKPASANLMPATPGAAGSGNAQAAGAAEDAGSTSELQRFADSAVQIARDADAQVQALQTIINNLRNTMEQAANAPG
jgi:HAMP domain-containing protein